MTTIRTIATALVTVLFTVFAALPASATERPSLTIRITDHAAVARTIGACDAGYALRDLNNAGSHHVAFRRGEATLVAPIAGGPIAPSFSCAGVDIGFPSAGVEFEAH